MRQSKFLEKISLPFDANNEDELGFSGDIICALLLA